MWKLTSIASVIVALSLPLLLTGQQSLDSPQIPADFNLDLTVASKLRPQLMAQSVPPGTRYKTGASVLESLIALLPESKKSRSEWELRIVEDGQFNAYSSPDAVVYVESGLARLAGSSTGLWAAILSHELEHVVHRDLARRYLFRRELGKRNGSAIVLGDPVAATASWADSDSASSAMARFCRQLELEADREALLLMARAGYHPDFVPSLHHLLNAIGVGATKSSARSMHPDSEERDRILSDAYVEASIEFEHRWPATYSSPGGNPPVVVFAGDPKVKKIAAHRWQISVPLHCQNLAGAVQVILRSESGEKGIAAQLPLDFSETETGSDAGEITGCTSPTTMVTFQYAATESSKQSTRYENEVYVLDAQGSVLARAGLSKTLR